MTALNIFYLIAGIGLILLGVAALVEKYRVVRGGQQLPARILSCEKDASPRKGAGGYRFQVEFNDQDGVRRTAATNDAFWFDHKKQVGQVIEIWYNPARPHLVERQALGTEGMALVSVLLGVAAIVFLAF